MPVERINRYKKTPRLRYCNEKTEDNFQQFQSTRGRSTSTYALAALCVLNLTFAFLEYWILGLNSSIPLFAYLILVAISLSAMLFSIFNPHPGNLRLRILIPGYLTLGILMLAVFLQGYRIYHAIEMALLLIWIVSLNIQSFRDSVITGLALSLLFSAEAYLFGATGLKMSGLIALLAAAYTLAIYLSYLLERFRRTMFLTNESMQNLYHRQESWAYTLIDMDTALSGIRDFKELIRLMMESIHSVIDYDSFVLTSLEGKGPKPEPDQIEGALFEEEDQTLWSDNLLTRLSQTRQAVTSSEFDVIRGFLGREKKKFHHFRLDIPVFNDSTLLAVISLRRKLEPFDDLDMTASVSIASQTMLIFKRTNRSAQMSDGLRSQLTDKKPSQHSKPAVPVESPEPSEIIKDAVDEFPQTEEKDITAATVDMDVTLVPTLPNPEQSVLQNGGVTVVPKDMMQKIRQHTESARKTITLLSRDNADQIAVDRYRTAAVEGEPLSILLLEVDGLPAIRENKGDKAAYRVFAGIVKYVYSRTDKDRDVLGRYGQNGFSILLPRVDMNAAEKFAESIRLFAEETQFKTSYGDLSATLSIGVAAITDETGNFDSMIKRADMALFVAKKNGRNCVKVRL